MIIYKFKNKRLCPDVSSELPDFDKMSEYKEEKMKKGFTLIELLVVIGIIAILALIVLVAVNPSKQFADSRNARRWNDVNTILNGIHQNAVDNNGVFSGTVAACTSPTNAGTLSGVLVPTYISVMPTDPQGVTDYTVCVTSGRYTVAAPAAEEGATIQVIR